MLYYLKFLENFWGPFRLFEYATVRGVLAAAIACAIGAFIAPKIIRRLQNVIQPERGRELLGEAAQEKRKVPTMGGLIIFFSALAGTLLCARPNVYVFSALTVFVGMTLVGFWDDYQKVVKKNSDGMSSRLKWVLTSLTAFAAFCILLCKGGFRMDLLEIWLPFMKQPLVAFDGAVISSNNLSTVGALFFAGCVLALFWLTSVGVSHAVNLTDGVDGLAAGCAVPNVCVFGAVAYLVGNARWAEYLNIGYVPGVGELAVFCAAIVAGILVFLWFNAAPANVYMGDTGSLALGGALGATALLTGHPFLLIISGGVFVVETGTAMLQIGYFKYTKKRYGEGRRIFLMTPIHHTWQLRGTPNTKLVVRCWIISLALAALALITLKLR
ncbi:MAG: phospho-N-acetylmuramoyl-pentapeptide-transferase [Verrucomicrobia bacterium]|nr:phospho-N-acetylmuramoyl-pentapeptide-transferase [Verrucomicrobiota bacterium]